MKGFHAIKRAIIYALLILTVLPPLNIPVRAAGGEIYLRVTDETTPFYSDAKAEDFLFFLPYTYYVKILSESGGIAHAEIGGKGIKLDGFVPIADLYDDGLYVEDPYPDITLTTVKSAVLYADLKLSAPIMYVFASRTLKYFGTVTGGDEVIYFVSYNDHLGYVKESDIAPFSIPQHPNPLTFVKEDPLPEPNASEERDTEITSVLRIVIIGALLLAGVIGLAVSLSKKDKPKKAYYYDENETE